MGFRLTSHQIGSKAAPIALLLALLVQLPYQPAFAQEDAPPPLPPSAPAYGLPFSSPPGPHTWFVVQYYGNTRTAFIRRTSWYGGGQGIHFGIDFAARCGTEVIAIADGTIIKIDAEEHGAGPHNLVVLHNDGFATLYGHLLERPRFATYTPVKQGQVIGLTGDPDLTCNSRPHLHLEIRDRSLYFGYNPVALIDADWDMLALFGPRSGFQRDLSSPRRWQTDGEQPIVRFGGGLINNYDSTWPPSQDGW